KVKQRTEVLSATVSAPAGQLRQLEDGLGDLKAAANAKTLLLTEGDELAVTGVTLAEPEEA
ncbi:hypothetical protein CRN61_11790, partial [Vibrio vulnificus]